MICFHSVQVCNESGTLMAVTCFSTTCPNLRHNFATTGVRFQAVWDVYVEFCAALRRYGLATTKSSWLITP